MAETASLSLSQMVDLALGTPEVGAVNFNVLHTLLHAVLQNLQIDNVKTDVDAADTDFLSQKRSESRAADESEQEQAEASNNQNEKNEGKSNSDKDNESSLAKKRRTPYHQLQNQVNSLEKKLDQLNALPSNDDLFEMTKAAQGGDNDHPTRPVADMWQNMQLNRRVGANEDGVNKLMSLVQDMMNEMETLKKSNAELKKQIEDESNTSDMLSKLKDLEDRLNDLNNKLQDLPRDTPAPPPPPPPPPPQEIDENYFVTWPALEDALRGIRQELQPIPQTVIEAASQTETKPQSRPQSRTSRTSTPGPSSELAELLERLGSLSDKHDVLQERVDNIEEQLKGKADKEALDALSLPDDLLKQLKDMQDMLDTLKKNKDKETTEEQLLDLRNLLEKIERRLHHMSEETELSLRSLEEQLQDLRQLTMMQPIMSPEKEEVEEVEEEVEEVEDVEDVEEVDGLLSKKISQMEHNIHKGSSEMMGLTKKMTLLTQDFNRQMRETKDKFSGLDNEIEQLINVLDELKKTEFSSGHVADSDTLGRIQQSLQQLQNELERLSDVTQKLMDDSGNKQKQIDTLFSISNKLEENKADKEFVQQEVDVKADKRNLDSKVNRTLFDTTCDELSKMISDILGKLSGHEEDWKKALALVNDDLDGKLDRLEFGPIRDELERQLKMLMRKLNQVNFPTDFDDDAAGIRKQMFNCISCDRPVEMGAQGPIPSIPASAGLPSSRSARPYTTFELEQIRQHAKSGCAGRNLTNFERAILERQVARCRVQADFKAYLVHFGKDILRGKRSRRRNMGPQAQIDVMDLYATSRACGGHHTLTYPNRRITRMGTINALFKEEDGPPPKDELDIQGADGHVYKGRNGNHGTKLPELPQHTTNNKSPKMFRKMPLPDAGGEIVPNAPMSPRPSSAILQRPGGVPTPRAHSALGRGQRTPPPSTDIPTGEERESASPPVPPPPAPSEPDREQAATGDTAAQ